MFGSKFYCVPLFLITFLSKLYIIKARGPHHPKSNPVSFQQDKHFHHDNEHLQEDLSHLTKKNVEDMSEEEKNFYYFKLHDLDNNNNLDGLEMLTAATHHDHQGITKITETGNAEHLEHNLNHIVEVIDDFLSFADLDRNGFLNYPEYIKALTVTNLTAIKR